jgi:hypothetical protein
MTLNGKAFDAVGKLGPLEVALYLRARQWKQVDSRSARASVWTTVVGKERFEVLLPGDPSVRDYAQRMAELLETLGAVESRPTAQIYSDLQTVFADVIRIRIDDPDVQDGTIPIEANTVVAQRSRDLLLAAACSAIEKREVWHSRKPAKAIEHLRSLRIGQTERGSYIVTVISRVTPALTAPANGQLFESDEPYDRLVTATLARSLLSVNRAAEQAAFTGNLSAFEDAVASGVNANFCDALSGLGDEANGQRSLDFQFSWSPTRPTEGKLPASVAISADRIPFIREAARAMRDRQPVDDFLLQGAVVTLHREEGSSVGRVTVIGEIDGKPKKVTFELASPHYERATEAHAQQVPLRTLGELVRDGRSYSLANPREIEIVRDAG